MPRGIHVAFLVDGILAIGSAAVAILFVGGAVDFERLRRFGTTTAPTRDDLSASPRGWG